MNLDFLLRLKNNLSKDYLTLVAAGIGFYFLLATFPAIAAVVSVYGLFADPHEISAQLSQMSGFVPENILNVVSGQAQKIAAQSGKDLSLGLAVSILLTMYGTSKGMKALIKGINMAYDQDQRRKLLSLNLVSFVLTVMMVIYFILSLSLIAGMPAFFQLVSVSPELSKVLLGLRWPVLFILAIIGLEILYYFGPSRKNRHFRFLSYGSLAAAGFWILGSVIFSSFVSSFFDFNEVYGSLGVGVALLFWFWLSALAILSGAEINATYDRYWANKVPAAEPSEPPIV